MSDIFLSYSAADRKRIGPLVAALTYQNWSVWWDRNISVGKAWNQVIADALESAKCVIVVWSTQSVGSQWVSNEAAEGMRRAILLPVLIDEVHIPLGFRHLQAANLVGWRGDVNYPEFRQLCRGIWALTHRSENFAATVGGNPVNPFGNQIRETPSGAAENQSYRRSPEFFPPSQTTSITADHIVSTLCYLAGPGGLIFLVFRSFSRNRIVRFHAFQASLFFCTWFFLLLILRSYWVFFIGLFSWIFVIIATLIGRTVRIPWIHKLAAKLV